MSASSSSFASTVDLNLRPSMRALRAVFVLHAAAIGLLPLAMEQGWAMIVLVAAFALSWLRLRRHPALGFGPQAIQRIVFHPDGSWGLHRGRGAALEAELLPGSLIHDWGMVLNFQIQGAGRVSRVILGDEVDAEALRRLRARLSLG